MILFLVGVYLERHFKEVTILRGTYFRIQPFDFSFEVNVTEIMYLKFFKKEQDNLLGVGLCRRFSKSINLNHFMICFRSNQFMFAEGQCCMLKGEWKKLRIKRADKARCRARSKCQEIEEKT